MRRLSFATLLFAVSTTIFMGCRQTASPSISGAMPSGSMSPAMQSPTFSPFGGSTRVTPPPPNGSALQNPYIGGPPGQTNAAPSTVGNFVSAAPSGSSPSGFGQVVGSGVQPATYMDTSGNASSQANFVNGTGSNPHGSGVATVAHGSHLAPANVNPFRAGGMQVNDLTRAPLPPGYRPAAHAGTAHPLPTVSPGVFPAQPAGTSAPAPVVPAPIVPAGGTGATLAANSNGISPISNSSLVQPVQGQQPQVWQGSYETQTQPAEIATRMVTVSGNSSDSILPAATQETVPAASQGSSTNDSTNLMWRRPGS